MKKLLIILSLCSNLSLGAVAQTDNPAVTTDSAATACQAVTQPITSSLSYGLGRGRMRNTYLTPLLYTGPAHDLRYERISHGLRSAKWSNQQNFGLTFSDGDSRSKLSSSYCARINYRYAAHRMWQMPGLPVQIGAGPWGGIDLGADYNRKMANGNNPAAIRMALNLGLSGVAEYRFNIRRQRCLTRLVVQTPLVGSALRPEYGASYYESFYLDNDDEDKTVLISTTPANQQDLDVRLTTDLPVAIIPWFKRYGTALRLGISYHIETMDANKIVSRYSSLQCIVGWTWQYEPVKHFRP